jgi:hypothetical protein
MNCTAFDIIESLGDELDITSNAAITPYKAYFTEEAYKMVKDAKEYIYIKDGQEYVKVFDNHVIPFIIQMRVAGIDNSIPNSQPHCGCRREIDKHL